MEGIWRTSKAVSLFRAHPALVRPVPADNLAWHDPPAQGSLPYLGAWRRLPSFALLPRRECRCPVMSSPEWKSWWSRSKALPPHSRTRWRISRRWASASPGCFQQEQHPAPEHRQAASRQDHGAHRCLRRCQLPLQQYVTTVEAKFKTLKMNFKTCKDAESKMAIFDTKASELTTVNNNLTQVKVKIEK